MVAVPKMSCLQIQGVGFTQGALHGTGNARPSRDPFRRRLTNTWQLDCHFVRFDAARCAFDELPIFIGKSPFQRDWVGRDSNPEPTP